MEAATVNVDVSEMVKACEPSMLDVKTATEKLRLARDAEKTARRCVHLMRLEHAEMCELRVRARGMIEAKYTNPIKRVEAMAKFAGSTLFVDMESTMKLGYDKLKSAEADVHFAKLQLEIAQLRAELTADRESQFEAAQHNAD